MSYWNYYESVPHVCAEQPSIGRLDESRAALLGLGYACSEVDRLTSSGYIALPRFGILIDRYYGGLLASRNFTSRFDLSRAAVDSILSQRPLRPCPVPVYTARSADDLRKIVSGITAPAGRRLVFRGQDKHWPTNRELPNPWFQNSILGETSLLPSLWRHVLRTCCSCIAEFDDWSLLDWSIVLYRPFDIEAIDAAIIASGQNPALMTMSDMADHPDARVGEFGEFRRALAMDYTFNLATALSTLLQHYGLFSPVLDVTTNLDVALFFATHHFSGEGPSARYSYVDSNADQSVVYVMWNDPREMEELPRDIVLQKQPALRPERQSCVVVRSGSYAMNLGADFLLAAIKLEGEGPWGDIQQIDRLFPGPREDLFLGALKSHVSAEPHVTDFSG